MAEKRPPVHRALPQGSFYRPVKKGDNLLCYPPLFRLGVAARIGELAERLN